MSFDIAGMREDEVEVSRPRRVHPALLIAAVTSWRWWPAAGFRATPSALIPPLQSEFRWSTSAISFAVTVSVLLFAVDGPIRGGTHPTLRRAVGHDPHAHAHLMAVGAGQSVRDGTVDAHHDVGGLGNRVDGAGVRRIDRGHRFLKGRGLVVGILTAGWRSGQLVFLPLVAVVVETSAWRWATLAVASGAADDGAVRDRALARPIRTARHHPVRHIRRVAATGTACGESRERRTDGAA
ncbi:hypothetical protein [Rhodococcus sp. WAY2]|uniref:hypothetical protein n=1 Tax=Rhodococcus sp. WAY2 TaxID=2663121 RepID=UPI00131FE0CF|nr:hypothetical protein [Rhodococcus sp. WAY2]QHE72393.1 putative integral membrane transport protein [Rhodococcus sp. WAY2]